MKPVIDQDEVVLNAAVLRDTQLTHRRVRCPGCGIKTFERWPDGWDAHAATVCPGVESTEPAARKSEFKATFRQLFRE